MAVAPLRDWTPDEIGKRLRMIREDMSMDQQTLARAISLSAQGYGKLEAGQFAHRPEKWLEVVARLHAETMGSNAKEVFDYLMCDRPDFAYTKHLGPSSAPHGDGGASLESVGGDLYKMPSRRRVADLSALDAAA